MSATRHFLTLLDFSPQELQQLIQRGIEMKRELRAGEDQRAFPGSVLAMIFSKSSTRTRVSFEAGIAQLGGHAMFLSPHDTQLGRGEPIEDSAIVISSMVDAVMIRTFAHETVERFATASSKPVINALTDEFHPCQLLADMQTYRELRGSIRGATVAWIGDGNNMCHSYINAAERFDFHLNVACPEGYEPDQQLIEQHADRVTVVRAPEEAARGAQLLVTDVWASMGQEDEQKAREKAFRSYQINPALMAQADKDALFMHCLPAHRGEEVAASVIDGPQSRVFDEAENRLHAQKAIIAWCFN